MNIRTSRALATVVTAALAAGGIGAAAIPAAAAPDAAQTDLKVMTYNIHHGVGEDKALDLPRIAKEIRDAGANVVGLQEVDNAWGARSNFEDQAARLGELLDMNVCYSANLDYAPAEGQTKNRQYGTAILSSYALTNCANTPLTNHPKGEQRGLAQADIEVGGQAIRFYNTHLTHNSEEGRQVQAQEIVKIVATDGMPSILVGDLNAQPGTPTLNRLTPWLEDTWAAVGEGDGFTFPVEKSDRRIDFIMAESTITPISSEVIQSIGSDHLPMVSTLRLPAPVDEDGNITFAWLSDIQYTDSDNRGTRHYRDSIPKLHDAAAAINAAGVDFTVHTGDMADRFRADFDDIMPVFRTINGPRYNVLGNHDWNEGMTTAEAVAALDMPDQYYDIAKDGWRFIFLNSSDVATFADPDDADKTAAAQAWLNELKATGAPNAQPWNGAVGAEQRAWLDAVLTDAAAKGERAIAFMHMPTFGDNMHNVWDTPEVQAVFESHDNLVAVLNGHDHAARYGYENGIHYLNLRGFVEQAYPATAWSIVTIEDGGIRVDGKGLQEDFFLPFSGPAVDSYTNTGQIRVTADLPQLGEDEPGSLALSIAEGGVSLGDARNAGDRLRLSGSLPQVSVTDTRADAAGWNVTGQATDLTTSGSDTARTIRAANLAWEPFLVSGKATPGASVASLLSGGAGLAAPATLGSSAGAKSTAVLAADMALEVPVDTKAGTYNGAVSVSLFPVD